jgi:hypothetical protein
MRWDELFADLEGQLARYSAAELEAEVADRTRIEFSQIRLLDRLRPALGAQIRLQLQGGGHLVGRLAQVGSDWLLVGDPNGTDVVVPLTGLRSVGGVGPRSAAPSAKGAVAARYSLTAVLRRISRDRAGVAVRFADGAALAGTIDRVGADFIEIAEHPAGEPRRRTAVTGSRLIWLGSIVSIHSRES